MEKFIDRDAVEIIKTALEAGALKLQGTGNSPEGCKSNAERDAMYLLTLLRQLTAQP